MKSLKRDLEEVNIAELIEADRLERTSVLAQHLAGTVKQPLSFIKTRVESLRNSTREYSEAQLQGILDQVGQLESFLNNFESFWDLQRQHYWKNLTLKALIDSLSEAWALQTRGRNLQLLNLVPEDLRVNTEADFLPPVLRALLQNAFEATLELQDRQIIISQQSSGAFHIINLEDNGMGMNPESMIRSLIPFQTQRPGHLGLSLSLCCQKMREKGGDLKLHSEQNKGTRVELWVPKSFFRDGKEFCG